jgi:hypothetical protein
MKQIPNESIPQEEMFHFKVGDMVRIKGEESQNGFEVVKFEKIYSSADGHKTEVVIEKRLPRQIPIRKNVQMELLEKIV